MVDGLYNPFAGNKYNPFAGNQYNPTGREGFLSGQFGGRGVPGVSQRGASGSLPRSGAPLSTRGFISPSRTPYVPQVKGYNRPS
jgi:hypothetical protein